MNLESLYEQMKAQTTKERTDHSHMMSAGELDLLTYLPTHATSYFVSFSVSCTRSMITVGQPEWDDIKVIGHASVSVCSHVCLTEL